MALAVPPRFRPAFLAVAVALSAGARAASGQGTASLSGTVRDSAGRPIVGAEVQVVGFWLQSVTDERGAYRIVGMPPGAATIAARRLGFKAFERRTAFASGRADVLDIQLLTSPELLQPMAAVAPREVYDARLAGFNARSQQKVGHFVTRERIERANSTSLTDVLREIPGVKMASSTVDGRHVRLRGATCAPLVFIDGFPAAAGEFDLDMVDLQGVEGIEVYSGLSSIPPEFSGPRDLSRCGVIAIWYSPNRARRRRAGEVAVPSVAVQADEIRTRDQVDEAARLDARATGPHYPDSLFSARVPGRVVVEFVVDTTGAVVPATIDILAASHPLFASAVRASLKVAHFTPAVAGGRKVSQYVQLPFTFAVRDSLVPR